MPLSHFRGGLKPPLPCGGGFTEVDIYRIAVGGSG